MALDSGVIYVVATPIGNLDDMTYRAVNVLRSVGIIAAEDTRHTRMLLSHFGIGEKRLLSMHEHNESSRVAELLRLVATEGESLALVSDAGTPLISDPGTLLVKEAWSAGIRLVPIVGASSLAALLSVSPFGAVGVRFVGFVPARAGSRSEFLEELGSHRGPALFLEAPHRIVATLEAIALAFPERRILIGRELTKLHEQILLGTARDLLPGIEAEHRGEFVCLLEGSGDAKADGDAQQKFGRDELIRVLKAELPPRKIAKVIARLYGETARDVYRSLTGEEASDDEGV